MCENVSFGWSTQKIVIWTEKTLQMQSILHACACKCMHTWQLHRWCTLILMTFSRFITRYPDTIRNMHANMCIFNFAHFCSPKLPVSILIRVICHDCFTNHSWSITLDIWLGVTCSVASDSVAKHQSFPRWSSAYKSSLSPSLFSLYHRPYTRFSIKYYSFGITLNMPSGELREWHQLNNIKVTSLVTVTYARICKHTHARYLHMLFTEFFSVHVTIFWVDHPKNYIFAHIPN
jgi:hypothetical protein